jgi:TetR/AcrR family transcriptional regulator, transcriptional repressor for nem operon
MARVREFDADEAVRRAMDLFWEQGYEATSLRDLTEALGIGSGSLYAAFGNKDGLFQAALARYQQEQAQPILDAFAAEGDVRAELREVLGGVVAMAVSDRRRRGCLVVNSATERIPHDADTAAAVGRILTSIEGAIEDALRRAQQHGELDPGKDPAALAGFFVTFMNGLRVAAKTNPDERTLMQRVDAALTVLD